MNRTASISIAALSLTSAPAWAGGFALNTQSAEALGAATAGAPASQATPANAYYNPAAIVGVEGFEGSISVVGVISDSDFENATGTLLGVAPVQGGSFGEGVIEDAAFPTGAVAAQVTDHIFVGLAAYAPFGFSSSYAEDSIVRYHATETSIVSAALTPILGVALNENWSIAGGVRIQYIDIELEGVIDAAGVATASMIAGFVPGTDDVPFELSADDVGVGYVFGVQGAVTEHVRVGASYTSKVEHDFSGQAVFDVSQSAAGQTLNIGAGLFQNTGVQSELTTPASIQFGLQADLTPSFTVLGSVALTRWGSFQQVATVFQNPVQPAELITQNWDDAWSGAIGAEYDLSPKSAVRFGVMYDETPVNDEFASPRIPDNDRLFVSAGFSQELSSSMTAHLAASYVFFEERDIDQPATRPENLFRGALQSTSDIGSVLLAVGVDFRF